MAGSKRLAIVIGTALLTLAGCGYQGGYRYECQELGGPRMQSADVQGRWSVLQRLDWLRPQRGKRMNPRYTPEELDARLKFVVGCILGLVLTITTIGVLYALVFVTQPIGAQAENDKMFFGVLSSVATFITGTLAGLMISTGRNKEQEPSAPAARETQS
jgi:hypothetical protein